METFVTVLFLLLSGHHKSPPGGLLLAYSHPTLKRRSGIVLAVDIPFTSLHDIVRGHTIVFIHSRSFG